MPDLQLGIWQAPGELLGVEARLAWLAAQCEQSADIDIALLPELFLSGYHAGTQGIVDVADDCQRHLGSVSALAKRHGLALALGYPERDGSSLYNSACVIDASGEIRLNHRKQVLPPGFELDCFQAGESAQQIIEYCGVRIALLVCFEVEFPEAVRACAVAGAELVLVPTALGADWGVVARHVIPTRAFENNLCVAYANHAGVEAGQRYLGESCIVGPRGDVLARAGRESQRVSARVDTTEIPSLRRRLPFISQRSAFRG